MSTYWYAVSSPGSNVREYLFLVGQNRRPEPGELGGLLVRRGANKVSWIVRGEFRLVCDGEDEFEGIQETHTEIETDET